MSEILPIPIISNEASFSLESNEAGDLNVIVYDYAGSMVAHLIQNRFIKENEEYIIPLNFEKLSTGMYNVEIKVGNDKVVRSIVVNK